MSTDVAFSVLAALHSFNVFATNGIQRVIKCSLSTEIVQCLLSDYSMKTE